MLDADCLLADATIGSLPQNMTQLSIEPMMTKASSPRQLAEGDHDLGLCVRRETKHARTLLMTRGTVSARAQALIDVLAIDTIRTLAIDAVQQANSGHPGTPMAMAPVAYTLWQQFLRFDPDDPAWPNRDRFVLSMGHASMLLYALLHLSGVKSVNEDYERLGKPAVTLDDIKRFRQLDSKCPGHPEYRLTSGVETTTGPLGQGAATSVGMAIAERWLAAHFNRPDFPISDYRVYAPRSDGDMMGGVSGR